MRCVRCGDWHEREAGDPYLPELCGSCFSKVLERQFSARPGHADGLSRFVERYSRNTYHHPTMCTLRSAWARLYPPTEEGKQDAPF